MAAIWGLSLCLMVHSPVPSFDSIPLEGKWHFNVRAGSGGNRKGSAFGYLTKDNVQDQGRYLVYTLSVYASKRVAKVITVKAGLTYRYYQMYHSFLLNNNTKPFNTSNIYLKMVSFLAFTGFEFMLGHFAINLEAGA